MSRKLLLLFAGGATALAAAACAAVAAPIDPGSVQQANGGQAPLVLVHGGHGGGGFGGHGGFASFHGGFGGFHGHAMGGPRFASWGFQRSHFRDHGFGHRHHRFFFAGGYPYLYDDYYYDDYYDSACWWSRRYHRWICPEY